MTVVLFWVSLMKERKTKRENLMIRRLHIKESSIRYIKPHEGNILFNTKDVYSLLGVPIDCSTQESIDFISLTQAALHARNETLFEYINEYFKGSQLGEVYVYPRTNNEWVNLI